MLQVCGSGYRAIDLIATATVGPDHLKQVIISIRTGEFVAVLFLSKRNTRLGVVKFAQCVGVDVCAKQYSLDVPRRGLSRGQEIVSWSLSC